MKLKIISVIGFVSVFLLMAFANMDKQQSDYHYLKERLEKTKSFTIEVIEAMPESDFDYKPTEKVRSYSALASHTVYSIDWNIELMKGTPVKWNPGDEDCFSKAELVTYANDEFDRLITFINNAKETPKLTNQLIDVLNHNAHHRGQMITYLRLKDITPPNYR
ncbi:DinB family protein [Flavivirga eckloniae]|nr:DinB family protein [Flavivirga eckloniae]